MKNRLSNLFAFLAGAFAIGKLLVRVSIFTFLEKLLLQNSKIEWDGTPVTDPYGILLAGLFSAAICIACFGIIMQRERKTSLVISGAGLTAAFLIRVANVYASPRIMTSLVQKGMDYVSCYSYLNNWAGRSETWLLLLSFIFLSLAVGCRIYEPVTVQED